MARVIIKHAAENFAIRRAQVELQRKRFNATLTILMMNYRMMRPYGSTLDIRMTRKLASNLKWQAQSTTSIIQARAYNILRHFMIDEGATTTMMKKMLKFHSQVNTIADHIRRQYMAKFARIKFMTMRMHQERSNMVKCLVDSADK